MHMADSSSDFSYNIALCTLNPHFPQYQPAEGYMKEASFTLTMVIFGLRLWETG